MDFIFILLFERKMGFIFIWVFEIKMDFILVFEIKIFLKRCEVVLKRKKVMYSKCFENLYEYFY